MKLLIIGSGAREHALAWKFRQDDPNIELIAAPGNPGIATIAQCFPVRADDIDGLFALAQAEKPDVTVVGPEAPLEAGIVDRFTVEGFAIFGPTQAAARIETSKRYAKEIMRRAGVPTAAASHHTDVQSAMRAARMFGAPVVIKASGLAAGKGVVIAETMAEAERAIRSMLGGALGQAGREILVEQYMDGEELSVFALCAGNNAMLLRGVQDHKRLLDGDHGPNTGGMGAYTPVSIDTALLQYRILNDIIQPTLAALTEDGSAYTGLLYAGLMVSSSGVKVVEFNCRFGDPETEALLPLMLSPLLDPVAEIARGGRVSSAAEFKWRIGSAVTTVVAAPGYPTRPRLGERVTLPPPEDNVYVFHAGTSIPEDLDLKPDEAAPLLSAGGRVLAVTGVAPTLDGAARKSQQYAERVQLSGKQFRHDIGWRELARVRSRRVLPGA